MFGEQRERVIYKVKNQLPNINEDRASSVLSLIVVEIESYNTCDKDIDWDKLEDVVVEILYQSMKTELNASVSSVRRGDTTISYESKNSQVLQFLNSHKDLIKRLIGCDSVLRFY